MQTKTLTRTTHFKLPTAILGAALDGDALLAACMDGVYWVGVAEKSARRIGGHDSYVSSAACLPGCNQLLTAGYDGVVQWFDRESKLSVRQLQAHQFWSWDMAVSPDEQWIASVTGQYLAGSYKYAPAPQREPCVRLISVESGEIEHSLPHVPSVQAVTFSHDSQLVAAGNLMGDVRVWNCRSGEQVASFNTPVFTSWGIIKSHCYLGGIFAMSFTPDDEALLLCGMGEMRDPMAGNGRQLWQKWNWRASEANLLDETHAGESGEGLMEALAIHPSGDFFAMGGRLRGGDWNVALFEMANGNRVGTIKTGYRVTELLFPSSGDQLVVVGGQGQPGKDKSGQFPDFGRVEIYEIS
jgi:WD40 repeat protein